MKRLLQKEVLRLISLAVLGAILGAFWGQAALGAACVLTLLLAQHVWQLLRLAHWLQNPDDTPPEARRLWGDIFDGIYHYQRRQKTAKQQLSQLLERIQDSSQALRDGIVMIDHNGDLEWWNQAAEQMLGLSANSDRGQPITYLLRNPKFVDYYEQQNYLDPLMMPSHLNEERMLEYHITLFGKNERLLLIRDCTKMQRLERMRQDFVANVSHELRTPLTVLAGYLETFSDYADELPARWQRGLKLMSEQSARMEHLVSELLTLSRLETSEFKAEAEPIDITQLLTCISNDALALSGHKHKIQLEVNKLLQLRGNINELRSAFSNLVFNAVKYTPEGSTITLSWYYDNAGAHLTVQDNGQGIDSKHLKFLTQRFYRVDDSRSSQTGGTGLGLAIVKHVLLRHQGRLEISSTVGQGSCFTCHFPASLICLTPSQS